MAARVARVVLDSPLPQLDRIFDYAIPDGLTATVTPGVRVRVPVRAARRVMDGWVLEVASDSAFDGVLAELDAVVSPVPVLTPEVWTLARRVADRAVGVAADVLRLGIPKRQARVEQAWLQSVPAVIASRGAAAGGVSRPPMTGTRLVVQAIPEPDGWLTMLAGYATPVVDAGRTAIIAVPDRVDLDRLEIVLAAAIGADRVIRLDAEQPPAARYRAFLAAASRSGVALIGTRSVVYAPAADLGLIALWDDGDPAFQEPLAPGVHARDAALIRQELCDCRLVLLAHSPSVEAERLVEIGWCERVPLASRRVPKVIPTAFQTGADRLAEHARIPSSAWRAAAEAITAGPVLVQVSRPGDDGPAGGERTAAELGKAFPQAKVIVSDGRNRVVSVASEPALVISTRGAEPAAAGGYRAVLLLDGERMLARESMRVTEDALRTWSNAIALAAPGAPSYLVGVSGPVARALAGWRQAEFLHEELSQRLALRLPPAVRTATLIGSPVAVDAAIAAAGIVGDDVIGPVAEEDGVIRTVVRFDYRRGGDVAAAFRTELLRHATGRRAPGKGRPPRPIGLRVRMDDPEPFIGERAGFGRIDR